MKGYYLYLLKRAEKECADKSGGIFEGIGRVMGLGGKFSAGFIAILVYFDYFLFTEGFGFSPAQFLQYLYGLNPFASSHLALFVLFYVIVAVTFFVLIYFIDRVAFSFVRYIKLQMGIDDMIGFFLTLSILFLICLIYLLWQDYYLVLAYILFQLYFSMMLYGWWGKSRFLFFVCPILPVVVLMITMAAYEQSIHFIIIYFCIMIFFWLIELLFFELSKPQQVKIYNSRKEWIPPIIYLFLMAFFIYFHSQNLNSWRDFKKNDFSFNLLLNRMFLAPISYDSSVRICVEPNIQKALSDAKDLVVLKRDDKICGGLAIDSADFKSGRYLPIGSNTFLYLSQDEKRALYMIVERRVNKFERRFYLAASSLKNFDP